MLKLVTTKIKKNYFLFNIMIISGTFIKIDEKFLIKKKK